MNDAMRARLELRRSSAADRHANRYREAKIDPPWDKDDYRDMSVGEDFE